MRSIFATVLLIGLIFAEGVTGAALAPRAYDAIGPGVSTIGTGGTYETFAAAKDALNYKTLIDGDWDFVILNDITVPEETFIVPKESEFTITFRPALGTAPTLTFSSIAGFANVWVGDGSVEHRKNIIFDGSNTPGGTTRDMTIKGGPSGGTAVLLHVTGNASDITFKNLNVENRATPAGQSQFQAAFQIATWWNSSQLNPPENITIDNCGILSTSSLFGHAVAVDIYDYTTGAIVPPTGVKNLKVTNCDIETSQRGVLALHVTSMEISHNRVRIVGRDSSVTVCGVLCIGTGDPVVNGTEIVVDSNEFTRISAPSSHSNGNGALVGVMFDLPGNQHKYKVINNAFNALKLTGANNARRFGGIQITRSTAQNIDVEIVHNSINMLPSDQSYATLTSANCGGIAITNAATTGTFTIRNNIIRNAQPSGSAISFQSTAGVLISEGNCLFASSGIVGNFRGADQATIGAWRAASGGDTRSGAIDPLVASPGSWTSGANVDGSNLRFSGRAASGFGTNTLQDVSQDLDGNVRNAGRTAMGAFEAEIDNNENGWALR